LGDKATKKELRRQRRLEENSQRAREQRRQGVLVWGGLGAITLVTLVVVFQAINPANQPGTFVRDQGNRHLSKADEPHIQYNSIPPTSGDHMPSLWQWGISREQIPDPWQLHNLEDGGVILQYDCPESCPELEAQLTELATQVLSDPSLVNPRTNSTHFILAPYSGIRAAPASGGKPIALTAWTRIQYFDQAEADAMMRFIRAYINVDHHVAGSG